ASGPKHRRTRQASNKEFSGLPGGNSEREPPDPIPNSEVKTLCADGSVAASHARVGHCQPSHAKAPMLERAPGLSFLWLEVLPWVIGGRIGLAAKLKDPVQTSTFYSRTAIALH